MLKNIGGCTQRALRDRAGWRTFSAYPGLKTTVENVVTGKPSQKYQKNVSATRQIAGVAIVSWASFWALQRTKVQCCIDVIGRWMPEHGCWKAQTHLRPKSSWNPKHQRIWASKLVTRTDQKLPTYRFSKVWRIYRKNCNLFSILTN